MGRKGFGLVTVVAGAVALLTGSAAAAQAGEDRSPVDLSSAVGGSTDGPAVSASGRYVAFTSLAGDLVAGDSNGSADVFVRDRGTGRTERVSVGTGALQARPSRLGSGQPTISADGRFIAFVSAASNLVPEDTNGDPDVFVRDRLSGTTARVSVASDGTQARRRSGLPAISADGRVVAFVSEARNLVDGDTNHSFDVFVRDLAAATTERVSISSSGAQVRGARLVEARHRPALSASGSIVAFASPSTGLVPDDRNGADDVFVRDRSAGTTSLVSVDALGAPRLGGSRAPSVSGDGRFVAFDSRAPFDAADDNRARDVYVRDRQDATTTWASPGTDGGGSDGPSLSGDGRYVLFDSRSPLVTEDTDGVSDVYRYDRTTATTSLASIDTWYGRAGTGPATRPSSSADGLVVAFSSAGGLVPDDLDPAPDVLEQVLDASRPSISFLGLVSLPQLDPNPTPISDVPAAGQLVYRVWGGGTRQFGASWTPVPPGGLGADRYRYSTGLPDRLNAGTSITFGALDAASSVVLVRPALPLNPNDTFGIPDFLNSGVTYRSYTGGVLEYIIPAADAHVLNPQTHALDPPYGGVPSGCTPAPRGCVGDRAG